MTDAALVTSIAVINCVDGFVGDPVLRWVQERFGVPASNVMTLWAPDKALSETTPHRISKTKAYILRCLAAKPAQLIIVIGHEGCTTNPVSREAHLRQLQQSVDTLASWELNKQGPRMIVWGLWMGVDGSAEVAYER